MSSCWRIATFHDMCPDWDMGVKRMPAACEVSLARTSVLTLETDSVALQTIHSLLEQSLSRRCHSGYIVLFPLNGSVDVFENLFYGVCDFCANTVTWDKGDLRQLARTRLEVCGNATV